MAAGYCDNNATNSFRKELLSLFRYESWVPPGVFIKHRHDVFADLRLPENEAQLTEQLRCNCSRCNRYPLSDTPGDPHHISNLINKIRECATGVYALCVFIQYARLVIPLLESQVTDGNLNAKVHSETDLRSIASFESNEGDIVSSFIELRSKFVTPVIQRSDPHLEIVNIGALPFSLPVNGLSGEIALPNTNNSLRAFDPGTTATSFYVTRVRANNEEASSEKKRYEWLRNKLGGPNLMEMLFSFRFQDSVYVLYDKTESNLSVYLRDPPASDHKWLLEQFGCVIEAMEALQKTARDFADSTGATPSTEFYGGHFNLEPSKLLIRSEGDKKILLVTGFGCQSPSKVASEYNPPEASKTRDPRNHMYDVWSLGHILIDIIKCVQPAVTTNGRVGPTRLVNGNGNRASQSNSDNQSIFSNPSRPSDVPKDLISLREMWKTDTLMCGRLDLIRDMMEINYKHRPSLQTVRRIYKHLFKNGGSHIDTFILPGESEKEIGLNDVHWLRLLEAPWVGDVGSSINAAEISAFVSSHSRRCRVQIFETYRDEVPTSELRIASVTHGEEVDLISQIKAYKGPGGRPNERLYLWFVAIPEIYALSLNNSFYVFDKITDLALFQARICGYGVKSTIPITSCRFPKKSSYSFGKPNHVKDARYIQIWKFPNVRNLDK
ncbi:hypothetical protein TWF694_009181 [Orbilia ellipsospora]|uniref:Protein kinase domain-containing protein n=1 Tax=Orbilia ellipsospora TaxID=2528407 RepID=A0AAV9XFM8_9PEZI